MSSRLLHFIGVCFLLTGCSSLNETTHLKKDSSSKTVNYSIIYIIHGDSNYLFHQDGERHQADEEVLKEAFSVAAGATSGEVFIYHQKPERKAFFFFPKKDRVFYHFKRGQLISKSNYSPIGGGLIKEISLFESNVSSSSKRAFLAYFGHEIPLKKGDGYHQSVRGEPFNIPIFISGLKRAHKNFDLISLSICNGGNPFLVDELTSVTKSLVTSPQNLHLSHLSSFKFNLLETNYAISSESLADSIARDSFEKLASFVQTEITIATYSLSEVAKYSYSLSELYKRNIMNSSEDELIGDNLDCKNIQNYSSVLQNSGVTTYYRSSSFGRNSGKKTHSGWGCKL